MKIKHIFIYLLLLSGCTEEILMSEIKSEAILVVNGFITNNSELSTIKLSYSSSTEQPEKIPCTDCTVTILDDKGNSEILTEIEDGTYITSESGIKGKVGNKYKIEIKTAEGKEYDTDFQEMKEVIDIDSIFAKEETIQSDEYPFMLPGLQFYINTKTAQTNNNYFLWTMTETYEYDIDRDLKYIETKFDEIIYNTVRYDSLKTCWKTENVRCFFTGKTNNLETSFISNKKLHFVNTKTKKLTKRYSVNVNQFIINKNAYFYWESIEAQISNDNFLNTTQPYNIKGNIKNKDNPNEIVYGYFTVASVSSKRIFVNKPRLLFYYNYCYVITGDAIKDYKRTHSAPFFYVQVNDGEYGITSRECIDCRSSGGDIYKPSFWISN